MNEADDWGRIMQREQAQEEHDELHPGRDKLVYCLSPDPARRCSLWPNCECGHEMMAIDATTDEILIVVDELIAGVDG